MYQPDARVLIGEHKHTGDLEQYQYNGKESIAAQCGTYSVWDDHAQQWGFYGATICNPTILLWPFEDRILGFKNMYDAIEVLRSFRL